MRNGLVAMVVVVAVLGCEPDGAKPRVGISRSALEQAPEYNIFTLAVAQEPVGEGWVMVPEADYLSALEAAQDLKSPQDEALVPDLVVASAANESWTSGVTSEILKTGERIEGLKWIVVKGAELVGDERVISSDFRLALVELSMEPSWYSTDLAFTRAVGSLGSDRCCGPVTLCNSPPESPSPCGGDMGYCGKGAFVTRDDTGAREAAELSGHESRQLDLFVEGLVVPTDCHPRLAPSCSNTNGMCGMDIGFDPFRDWDSPLPMGTGACGGLGESPMGGRNPPPICLYANSVSSSIDMSETGRSVSQGGGRYAECDGRCFDCETTPYGIDMRDERKFRPRQCDLVKTAPPGAPGAPGSGVCSATSSQEILTETEQIRIQYFGGPGGTGTYCEFINNQGLEMCTSCDLDGCRKYARRAGVEYPPPGNGGGVHTGGGTSSGSGARISDSQRPVGRTQADAPPTAGSPMGPLVAAGGGADEGATPEEAVESGEHATDADPVALGSGAFELRQTDLSLPGPTRPLEFVRSYDSRSKHRSPLGSNWSHNWDVRIVALNDYNRPSWVDPYCAGSPEETTCLMLHIGATERLFTLDPTTGIYTPQAGVFSSITKIESGWRLVGADMHRMEFEADGYLVLDLDRFDHGFMLEYEYTPQGQAFNDNCPRELPRPSRETGELLNPGSPFCQVLGGLVGQRRPHAYRLNAADEWSLATLWPPDPGNAPYFATLMADPGRNGSPMPWGAALKRVTRAAEVASVSYVGADRIPVPQAGGRALVFAYAEEGTFLSEDRLQTANLLESVSVENQSISVTFSYQIPKRLAEYDWLNEVLLHEVTREDGRYTRFFYSEEDALDKTKLIAAGDRYREFLKAQVGCTSYSLNHCGGPVSPSFTRYDIESDVADYKSALRSEAIDNIWLVERDSTIESETRYELDPFSPNFDRATAQRWGSSAVAPTPLAGTFTTTLPEARLEYVEATPINEGLDDATTAFLGTTFSNRYPLETAPEGAIADASGKGMLLAPSSPDETPITNRLPALADGFLVTAKPASRPPACFNSRLPWLRSRLAGYAPTLDYFDLPDPAVPGSTPGVDLEASLKRSRLSCSSLAMAQTWDARHNDLQWSWALDGNAEMQATRILGRRAKTNANANRICAWSRVTDRDGELHLYGLNYQGRTLVDALQMATNDWRIAETLYNADGNVISQRRTMTGGTSWTAAAGDTQYEYMDIYKDSSNQNIEPLPFYWARRGNITRVLEHPRGLVEDYIQNSTAAPTQPTGRFVRYKYEPLFNQVAQVASGTLPGGTIDSVVNVTFDYQEGDVGELLPLLQFQQSLGFQYQHTITGGTSVLEAGTALDWPVTFDLGDQNGDQLVGTTRLGLPIRVDTNGEQTLYRWNEGGRLTSVLNPDGSELRNQYYPYGAGSGVASPSNRGQLAKQLHVARTSWWTNPSLGAGCAALAGPYQWLLPAGCTTAELQSVLKLPAEAVAQITAPALDGTLTLEYNGRGGLERREEGDGRVTTWVRDADGRVTKESILDGTTLHSTLDISYDTLRRPAAWTWKNAAGAVIGKEVKVWDEEDHVLVDCHEWVAGACTGVSRGTSPANAAANSYYYTRDGLLQRQEDPEGAEVEFIRDARGWLVRSVASAPGEEPRENCTTYDNDGNVTRRDFGGDCGLGQLFETRSWDGFNRLKTVRDSENRNFTVKHSNRDFVVEVAFVGTPTWKTTWTYDVHGRVSSETLNGNLVEQYNRTPGGLVGSSQSYGRAAVFTTYDADGNVVWQRDSDSRLTSVYTSRPNSRIRTASTISSETGRLHTTSSIVALDELGLPESSIETGESLTAARKSRTTTYLRDPMGRLKQQDDPDGATVEFVYDFGGRLERKKESSPAGFEESVYGYDRRGAVTTILDPKIELTTITYTGFGEAKTRTSPGAGGAVVAQFSYDTLGRTTEERLGTSRLNYIYNGVGQLWKIQNSELLLREYAYDTHGRLTMAKNFNRGLSFLPQPLQPVTTRFDYDWAGRTKTETNLIAGRTLRTVDSTWSGGTMPTSLTRYASRPGSSVDDQLDGLGRLQAQTRQAGTTYWKYLGEFNRERSVFSGASSVTTMVERDALGQTQREATQGQDRYEFDILRDEAGRTGSLSKRIVLPSGVEEKWRGFTYDRLGRINHAHEANALPQVSVGSGSTDDVDTLSGDVAADKWSYAREPKVGSTVSITGPGPARIDSATRGVGYQLSSYQVGGGATRQLTYDTAGRVSTHAGVTHSWDDFSLLTHVSGPGVDEWLQYDGVGRLVSRYGGATLVEEYVWDGSQMVAAFNGGSVQVWSAYWGQGVDNLVTLKMGDTEYAAVTDGRGSIGAWYTPSDGKIAATAEYTPEGRAQTRIVGGVSCDEVGNANTCPAPLGLPFGFHSAFKSSGTGLIYFRNRWYSAVSGEWLSQDPLGPVDSHNLYAFNGFDSVNFSDPFGLKTTGAADKFCDEAGCYYQYPTPTIVHDTTGPTKADWEGWTLEGRGSGSATEPGITDSVAGSVPMPSGPLGPSRPGPGRPPVGWPPRAVPDLPKIPIKPPPIIGPPARPPFLPWVVLGILLWSPPQPGFCDQPQCQQSVASTPPPPPAPAPAPTPQAPAPAPAPAPTAPAMPAPSVPAPPQPQPAAPTTAPTPAQPKKGSDASPAEKKAVRQENRDANGGKLTCENCRRDDLVDPQRARGGIPRPPNEAQVDHIIPKADGGEGRRPNLRVLCPNCNKPGVIPR